MATPIRTSTNNPKVVNSSNPVVQKLIKSIGTAPQKKQDPVTNVFSTQGQLRNIASGVASKPTTTTPPKPNAKSSSPSKTIRKAYDDVTGLVEINPLGFGLAPAGTKNFLDEELFRGYLPGGISPSQVRTKSLRDSEALSADIAQQRLQTQIDLQLKKDQAAAAGVSPDLIVQSTQSDTGSSGGFLDNLFKDSGKLAIGVLIGVIAFALIKR